MIRTRPLVTVLSTCIAVVICAGVLHAPRLQAQSVIAPAASRPAAADIVRRLPLDRTDSLLQAGLERLVRDQGLSRLVSAGSMAVAVVDLSRPGTTRFAALNGDRMMYAASLPKIAILLGAFDAIDRGRLRDTPALREEMVQMIRVSSNAAATSVLRQVGFESVSRTLMAPALRLYDDAGAGGLWVGKAYGRDSYWRRDPIASLSHGATARQTARFFALLDRGLLVSARASAAMKEILGNPGIRHKFVRGLEARPGASIFRKSGSWRDYHADAALVVRPDARYVIVGLVQDPDGERILQRLAPAVDDLVRSSRPRGDVAVAR